MATREFHDAAFKRRFDRARTVEDLLRGFAPGDIVEALNFETLEQLSPDYVDDSLARGSGDAAWRVRFRGAAEDRPYLLVLRWSRVRFRRWRRRCCRARSMRFFVAPLRI